MIFDTLIVLCSTSIYGLDGGGLVIKAIKKTVRLGENYVVQKTISKLLQALLKRNKKG